MWTMYISISKSTWTLSITSGLVSYRAQIVNVRCGYSGVIYVYWGYSPLKLTGRIVMNKKVQVLTVCKVLCTNSKLLYSTFSESNFSCSQLQFDQSWHGLYFSQQITVTHPVSWTTLVVHSRDIKDCGGAPRRKFTLKPAKIPCITIWQYWLGNTKPKKAFRLILNTLKKLLQNF